MTGQNKTPLVGWHPSADLVAWLEAEVERRGGGRGTRSAILDEALAAYRASAEGHDERCLYCEHGPYCLTCPPPASIPDDAYVCGPCREEITRSETAADPYYQDGAVFGDGA